MFYYMELVPLMLQNRTPASYWAVHCVMCLTLTPPMAFLPQFPLLELTTSAAQFYFLIVIKFSSHRGIIGTDEDALGLWSKQFFVLKHAQQQTLCYFCCGATLIAPRLQSVCIFGKVLYLRHQRRCFIISSEKYCQDSKKENTQA